MADLVTVEDLRETLGIGQLYEDDQLESVCVASSETILAYLWKNTAAINAVQLTSDVARIATVNPHNYAIGETVTITNAGETFNGEFTVTSIRDYSFTYALVDTDVPITLIRPFATVAGPQYIDYTIIAAVREAALSLAASIWQARQTSSGGSVALDFTPSPWQLGSSLISKVKGLLAPYMSPEAIIG
jgi:hypothetical protein